MAAGSALALAGCTAADDGGATPASRAAKKPSGERNVYFGDHHLHTRYSLDAAPAKTNTTSDDGYSNASQARWNRSVAGHALGSAASYWLFERILFARPSVFSIV